MADVHTTKPCVLQLLFCLRPGGAERLALNILEQGQGRFRGIVAGLYEPPGDLAAMAERIGLSAVALRAEGKSRLTGIRLLYNLLRREKVTLLHAQATYLLPFALPAALLAGVPLLYTEHSIHALTLMPKLRLFIRLATPLTRGAVCVSEQLAEYFEQMGVAPGRITVIPNGVNLKDFTPQGNVHQLPWNSEPRQELFVFGTVGRLNEAKDHGNLLRAFALVSRRHAGARLLLVGDGELRGETETLVRELRLEDKVHLPGMSTDIPPWLRAMDCFVLSSKREGLPMAVLEAMACGLPVVSTDVGAIASLNRQGEHVLLAPAQDPPALARAMENILEEQTYRERLGAAGYQCALQQYGSQAMAEHYIRLYQKSGGIQ